jgi:hypothetical protein
VAVACDMPPIQRVKRREEKEEEKKQKRKIREDISI